MRVDVASARVLSHELSMVLRVRTGIIDRPSGVSTLLYGSMLLRTVTVKSSMEETYLVSFISDIVNFP